MTRFPIILAVSTCAIFALSASADDLLHNYDGSVVPYDPSMGWTNGNPCEAPCQESIENGFLIHYWPTAGNSVGYLRYVSRPPNPPLPSLWVEWGFRSNHLIGPYFISCDGSLQIDYAGIHEYLYMYGDATITQEGSSYAVGLNPEQVHTYRFESTDGIHYRISVDGLVFVVGAQNQPTGTSALQFAGKGGCLGDKITDLVNEWDFVRFGTIGYGEQIISSDPHAGFIDAHLHPALDRFTIRYDSPNYVYLDDISIDVIPNQYRDRKGAAKLPLPLGEGRGEGYRSIDIRPASGGPIDNPIVLAIRRLDNGPPDVVEILLDRPIPYNATTRFTFDDGVLSQSIEFTYAPGDIDGDGQSTLSDLAAFQNCFGPGPLTGLCPVLDLDANAAVNLSDFALLAD